MPCQDLSVAGKMRGMSKGSGTRSGLLWEVERLLKEMGERPQVLLMENVPGVVSPDNIDDFHSWQQFLESIGYTNYFQIINAKDQGVAQNRERAFMVSILNEKDGTKYNYNFPSSIPLDKTMADYLEDSVDEKYYINSPKAQKLIDSLIESGTLADEQPEPIGGGQNRHCVDGTICQPKEKSVANCIKARYDCGISNQRSDGTVVAESE